MGNCSSCPSSACNHPANLRCSTTCSTRISGFTAHDFESQCWNWYLLSSAPWNWLKAKARPQKVEWTRFIMKKLSTLCTNLNATAQIFRRKKYWRVTTQVFGCAAPTFPTSAFLMLKARTVLRWSRAMHSPEAPSLDSVVVGARREGAVRKPRLPVQSVHLRRAHLQRAREPHEPVPGFRSSAA